jgi:hypothetical protein
MSPPTTETSPAVKDELSSAKMDMAAGLPAQPAAPSTDSALTLPEGPLVTFTRPATVTLELP